MQKRKTHAAASLLMAMLTIALLCMQAFAAAPEPAPEQEHVSVTIPFTATMATGLVTIEPQANAPVPEVTHYTEVRSGEFTMAYTEPGYFEYTVTQSAGDTPGVTYDTSEYHVTVCVFANPDGSLAQPQVSLGKNGETGKPDSIVFTNTLLIPPVSRIEDNQNSQKTPDEAKPTGGNSGRVSNTAKPAGLDSKKTRTGQGAKTGDSNYILAYAICGTGACVVLICLATSRNKKKEGK